MFWCGIHPYNHHEIQAHLMAKTPDWPGGLPFYLEDIVASASTIFSYRPRHKQPLRLRHHIAASPPSSHFNDPGGRDPQPCQVNVRCHKTMQISTHTPKTPSPSTVSLPLLPAHSPLLPDSLPAPETSPLWLAPLPLLPKLVHTPTPSPLPFPPPTMPPPSPSTVLSQLSSALLPVPVPLPL